MSVGQEQYKYCFKVLWDYSKCNKTTDDGSKRPAPLGLRLPARASERTDSRSECADQSEIRSISVETASLLHVHPGVNRTLGQTFSPAFAVRDTATGRHKPAFSGVAEIELSNSMSSIA